MADNLQMSEYVDATARATRIIAVDATGTTTGSSPAARAVVVARYAVGPTGASAHGTHTITAGARSYAITVIAAAGATPTLGGVALPAGLTLELAADGSNTLPAASLITAAGDDVMYTEVR